MSVDLVVSGVGTVVPPAADAPDGWYDYKNELGASGYRHLPSATQYLLGAAKRALADSGADLAAQPVARGAVVGTNSAANALHAEMDATVIGTDAARIRPVVAPFFSINLFGSKLAIEHGLQAFNVTLTSPVVAGLEALQVGARAVRLGRAKWLLAGATEERIDPREPAADRSERGAVVLVLEPAAAVRARGGRGYGRCQVATGFLPPARAVVPGAAAELLARLGVLPGVPVRVACDDSAVGTAVQAALRPDAEPVPAGAGCLEPVRQVAALLASGGGPGLVVAAAATGSVAVALVTGAPETPAAETLGTPDLGTRVTPDTEGATA